MSSGVLYGVMEFNKKLATLATHDKEVPAAPSMRLRNSVLTDSPVIENRGIWTWGYVIYDYRRFFDNMARLKMNRLTVWNDRPPVNCRQFIDYAHSRGIKVILGYSWGICPGEARSDQSAAFAVDQGRGSEELRGLLPRPGHGRHLFSDLHRAVEYHDRRPFDCRHRLRLGQRHRPRALDRSTPGSALNGGFMPVRSKGIIR